MLTDTKWGRHKTFEIQGHTKTWTVISGGRVSIALSPSWAKAWQDSKTVVRTDGKDANCRIIMLQIQCFRKLGLAIMGIYSPSSKATAAEIEEHLGDISRVMGRCRPRYVLVAGGDYNAETGSRNNDTGSVLGPHGWRTCNPRGQKLLTLCQEHDLIDTHSWTQTTQPNKATRTHPRFKSDPLVTGSRSHVERNRRRQCSHRFGQEYPRREQGGC